MSLDFALKREAEGWDESTDRHLHRGILEPEWVALFFKVLGCPPAEPYVNGEDTNEFRKRFRQRFREAIPEYPMLARITDYYDDVWYQAEEVVRLRGECERVRCATEEKDALKALMELLAACQEAQSQNLGLLLVAD